MHKPLWSYILSAGRFLSLHPPRTWNTVIPPVIRIPLRRVHIHVQPPAIRTEFPLVYIYTVHIIMIYWVFLPGMFNFLIYFLGV